MADPNNFYNRPREPEPDYTHELHAARCGEAARRRQILVQHVLAKRGQIVYCAVIKAAWTSPSGVDCWTIETSWPEQTRITVPCRNTIACDPNSCSCRPAAMSGGAPLAGIPLQAVEA